MLLLDNKFVSNMLIELLLEYNRVSLPCLGSFMGQYRPSYFADGKIYPPSKQIEFHQNEIWNDERLEIMLADLHDISLGQAKEQLAFWIDDVCVTLAKGNTVNLPGLGCFTVLSGSVLSFEQQAGVNFLKEAFGLEPQNMPVEVEPSPQPTPIQPVTPIGRIPQPAGKSSWGMRILLVFAVLFAIASILLALFHFRVIPVPGTYLDNNPWVEHYLRPLPDDAEEDLYAETTGNDMLVFPGENYDGVGENNLSEENIIPADSTYTPLTDSVIATDSIPADSLAVPDSLAAPAFGQQELYYIIVKSFPTYDGARALSKTLARKGYIAQIIEAAGTAEPYKVSVSYFVEEDAAAAYLNELKSNHSADFKTAAIEKYAKP